MRGQPQDLSLTKTTTRFTLPYQRRNWPCYGHLRGEMHREGSCSKAARSPEESLFVGPCLGGGALPLLPICGPNRAMPPRSATRLASHTHQPRNAQNVSRQPCETHFIFHRKTHHFVLRSSAKILQCWSLQLKTHVV